MSGSAHGGDEGNLSRIHGLCNQEMHMVFEGIGLAYQMLDSTPLFLEFY